MRGSVGPAVRIVLPPVITLVALLAIWDWSVTFWQVPGFLLPRPGRVIAAMLEHRGELAHASGMTAASALCGFLVSLVLGTLIAFVFSLSPVIQRSFYPYAIFLQTVPIVAIAPLIVIWFQRGFQAVVVVSTILGLFPIITNVTAGLTRVDSNLLELFRVQRATWLQTLLKLRVPNSVPYLVAGAKISCGLAVIGAIVGEMFAGFGTGSPGLGHYIRLTSEQLKADYALATVFCSTLLGVVFFGAINLLGATVLARWHGKPQSESQK